MFKKTGEKCGISTQSLLKRLTGLVEFDIAVQLIGNREAGFDSC